MASGISSRWCGSISALSTEASGYSDRLAPALARGQCFPFYSLECYFLEKVFSAIGHNPPLWRK
jgi:hypothetical protein